MLKQVYPQKIRSTLGTRGRIDDCMNSEAALVNSETFGLKILDNACFNGSWAKTEDSGHIHLKCKFNDYTITLKQNGDPITREYSPSGCIYSCSVTQGVDTVLLVLDDSLIAQSRFLYVHKKHFGIEHVADPDKSLF